MISGNTTKDENMNTAEAETRIESALSKLEKSIGAPVFDEWAIVHKQADGWKLVRYSGNRSEAFAAEFKNDITALRETLDPAHIETGDFAFSHEGYGSGFDAHMCIGTGLLLLLNNTEKSTGEITSNPRWTSAQIFFSELLESFIADPLAV